MDDVSEIYKRLSELFGPPCEADLDVDCTDIVDCEKAQKRCDFSLCWKIALMNCEDK